MSWKPADRENIEALADWLLAEAKRRGAEGAEVAYSEGEGNSLSLKDGEVEECISGASSALGVRVLLGGGRQGAASGDKLDKASVSELLDWSLSNAGSAEPEEGVFLYSGEPLFADPEILQIDPEIDRITAQQRMESCRQLTALAGSADSRIISVRAAVWQDGRGSDFYASTEGLSGWERGSSASCEAVVLAQQNGCTEMGGYGMDSHRLCELDVEKTALRAVSDAVSALGGSPVKTGNYTIVLEPEAAASLIEITGDLFCATDIQKNRSMMKDKLGEAVASACFTLSDNGRIPWKAGTSCWDSEGVPTGETVLIENGIAKNYLYNLQSAYKDGVKSTGNCVRGLSTLPNTGCSNLVLKGGGETEQALVASLKKGIYLTEFMGLHTIDPVSGDFSVGAKGLLIESGEKTRPVSGITIASNLFDFLKNITAVGSDVQFFDAVSAAALVVENITVAGK